MKLFDYFKKSLNSKKTLITSTKSSDNSQTTSDKLNRSPRKSLKQEDLAPDDETHKSKHCLCFDNYAYGNYATRKTN